jgi:hypothetical protein
MRRANSYYNERRETVSFERLGNQTSFYLTGQAIAAIVGNAYMRSLQGISGALHLGIFDQPGKSEFFNRI